MSKHDPDKWRGAPIPIDAGLSREERARRGALGIIENHERLVARCRQLEDAVKRLRHAWQPSETSVYWQPDVKAALTALFAMIGDTP